MPLPRWLAKVNRRVFNPLEVKRGKRPIVTHMGRSSGASYQTPLDAYPTKRGFVLVVRYGPGSDWVRNILAAGKANLRFDEREHSLSSPRLVGQEDAVAELEIGFEPRSDFFKADHYLLMNDSS